jgi:hypothetical protein
MARGTIEIRVWQPPLQTLPQPGSVRDPRRVTIFAGLVTVALHFLFFGSFDISLGRERSKLLERRRPILQPQQEPMQWIDLTQTDDERALARAAGAQPEVPGPVLQAIILSEPFVPKAVEDSIEESTANLSENTETESVSFRIYARYVGQIDARIERAWARPRTTPGVDLFSCAARIEQDKAGNVIEINLLRCNGDTRWRQSLLHAIRVSSPLPAPPDPSVFRRTLTLTFTSLPYSNTSNPDLYEPEDVSLVAVDK